MRGKKYEEKSPVDFLLFGEKLGLKRYRKTVRRDEEKREILLELSLKKIKEKEKGDFVPLGYRRKKLKFHLKNKPFQKSLDSTF